MAKIPDVARLHFIDGIRAWAILMMLQGHFIDTLLADSHRDLENPFFYVWHYLRGVTAPVFFVVSGFIFTYLLVRKFDEGLSNPRVKKGLLRGLKLIAVGYILQIRFLRLLKGTINDSYNIVHVLQCLGLSLILIVLLYLLFFRFKRPFFSIILLLTTITSFIFKTEYEQWDLLRIPEFFANYFITAHGSVFTILPWFGFTSFGGCMALAFTKFQMKKNFYQNAIVYSTVIGLFLIQYSYNVIKGLRETIHLPFLENALDNSYLFARLGLVLLIFALFALFKDSLKSRTILKLGQLTLLIYVIHSVALYNSITGYGLSRFYYHSQPLVLVCIGALCFVVLSCLLALKLAQKYPKTIRRLF